MSKGMDKIRNRLRQRWSTTTHEYVSRRIGVSAATVCRFLSGESNSPTIAAYAAEHYGDFFVKQLNVHKMEVAHTLKLQMIETIKSQEEEYALGLGFGTLHEVPATPETHHLPSVDLLGATAREWAGFV